MNQALTIDEPLGPGWRFSLDATAPTSAYQESRTFTQDASGQPFVDGKDYLLYAYHEPTGEHLTDSATFWTGPTDYVLRKDADLPDLGQITRRGAITIRTLTVGGLRSKSWPLVKHPVRLFAELALSDGASELALLSLADLAELLAPLFNLGPVEELPAYVPVQIWRWVIDTSTDELPAYVPVRIWRFVPDTVLTRPAPPSNLELIDDGGRWKLKFTDNSDNEASFRVVRKTADGTYQPYVSIPANTTLSGYLPDIDGVSTYTLKIQAVNGAGESGYSNEVVLRPPTPVPTVPTITKMYTAIVAGPAPKNTLAVRPELSVADEVEWKWVNASGSIVYADWTAYGIPAPWQNNDYLLYFDTGVPAGTIQYLYCRPKSNPSAVSGPYACVFGGTGLHTWQLINPS
ncbi:fibronectin type III domain-containing protein [Fibrella forsythiae]|uniref:Fibronectin type III domain-containing protein n=1 Tax=Fibrella forsythiae TaxID=2817061 RepID=A0ABS3JAD2_9BACT|nr:fibronectin type III domain-containing protein [Fibrella forsythiae]MBO0946955.1 fibronectin type III domain-containing protein [Fibrella forsythiae]